ncbi:iron-containing alcohol dehydrogenase [Bordetella genomosp. 5]|uniref:Alcohol dehydrogenase n=1 Tax=Bordetella genomosp. 5 TaxID=1395608 RepID=A0A261TAU3_9BORD|nr:iron-containing alcohol dehydrogenase [Bordetella genomosp. 5]OZI46719.1 alcohol dehydrogenase [Bordetella genomosp. 5]
MQPTSLSTFFCPTRLYLGAGAHRNIADIVRKHDCKRLFITIDAALLDSAFYADIRRMLEDDGVALAHYAEIEPDPSAHTVTRAFEACNAHQATLLLAIGGGSTMDVAKAVGILATNGGRIHDYEGIEKFSTPGLPLIAVPTTAGTGSEVSGSCVITDTEANRKMSIRHASLNPAAYAILDPLALRTVPAHVAAHSGMDAFVHAFESFISRQSNLITDAINLQAIALLSANIRPFVANRENLDAGMNMLVGSALAGITFGQTGLGNVHCMARFLGAACHISHGLSNAVCLPVVARFNLAADPAKFARIAAAMDRPVQGLPQLDAARAAVDAIETLCRDLGIPARLRDVGARADMLDELARLSGEAGYNRWNPRQTSQADFRGLFEQAY